MKEVWKPIGWIDGLTTEYEVSNYGRVKSVRYKAWIRGEYRTIERNRILNNNETTAGYHFVHFNVFGKLTNFAVHRLVATAFIPKEAGKDVVNHIDHNRQNNYVGNLEWVTVSENNKHSSSRMRHPKANARQNLYGKGIKKRKSGFEVSLFHANKFVYVGSYKNLEEAMAARDEAFRSLGLEKYIATCTRQGVAE